jgi:ankyrin repeat protein
MLALRLRSKSRGRSKSRSRLKKRVSHELAGVPAIVTICKNNTEYEERIQVQKSKKARNKKRSQSRKRTRVKKNTEESWTETEILRKSQMNENTGAIERSRNGAKLSSFSSEINDISLLSPSANDRKHTFTKGQIVSKYDSIKSARSLSGSNLSLKSEQSLEEQHNIKKQSDTRHQLREQLMKECLGAIDRRQKQARGLLMISVDEQKSRTDFDNLLKQSIKHRVTRPPIATTKCNAFKSNPPPPTSDKRGSDKKEKPSTSKNHKALSTATALSADTSSNSTSETKSPRNCHQDNPEKTDTENMSGWRKTVSKIIAAGRSRSKSRSRPLRKSRSWAKTSANSGKRSDIKKETSQKVDASKISTGVNKSKNSSDNSSRVKDGSDLKWHHTIMKHDWDVIRTMLKSYDHTKFRQRSNSMGRLRYPRVRQEISPLLHVDANGRTPLHLACKEHMPSRLLRRLLFVERNAASVQDNDGRYPLHLVVINSLDQHILDRLIHASPDSLGIPDHLNHTPIQYAVLKADRSRGNKEVMWGPPRTKVQAKRQKLQTDAYQSVVFILESMVKRRKVMCIVHESQTLIEAVELFAPPKVVDLMVILSEKILHEDQNMSKRLVDLVFQLNHPLNVIHRVLEATSKIIPAANLLETVRQRLTDHFTEDCNGTTSKSRERKVTTSFAKQFAKVQKEGRTSSACKDWWDKLRYLIARSSDRTSNWKNDTVLHMALCNPKSHPSMIEYLCRLKPAARYKRDDVTGALPIHLACMHWHPEKYGIGSESSQKKVLNLLLAGDFDLVRRNCHGRTALHYAALNGKSMPYIQSLLNLNQETASIRDPETKFLPFQLAAISEKCDSDKPTLQLDTIYCLLRANPSVVSTPPMKSLIQKQK